MGAKQKRNHHLPEEVKTETPTRKVVGIVGVIHKGMALPKAGASEHI